jgi:MFS family permease
MMDALHSTRGTSRPDPDDQGWTLRWLLSLVSLVMVFEAVQIGYSMISLGLPSIVAYFQTDQGGWLLTSYLLAGAVGSALLGKLADLYGKRRILMLTLAISAVGAMICAVAPTFEIMIFGRVLQGIIVACLPLSYSLIRDVFPRRLAPFAVSISVTGMGALSIVTPILVGWLLTAYGFRGMFWFDVLWTAGFCLAIWATTPESPLRRRARVDILGALLLGGGVAALLLVISMGGRWGWTSATALLFGVVGVVLLVAYRFQARRASEPILNLELFRSKPIVLATVVAAVAGISTIQTVIMPLLALTPRETGGTYGLGLTALEYAFIEAPRGLAAVLAGLVVGVVVSKFGTPRLAMIVGMAIWAAGFVFLAFRNDSVADLVVAAVLFGIGYGLLFASVPNLVIAATPPGDQGATAGAVQVCQTGFGSILPVVLFAILATQAVPRPGGGVVYLEAGFQYGLFLAAGIAVVGIVLALTVLRTRAVPPAGAVTDGSAVAGAEPPGSGAEPSVGTSGHAGASS